MRLGCGTGVLPSQVPRTLLSKRYSCCQLDQMRALLPQAPDLRLVRLEARITAPGSSRSRQKSSRAAKDRHWRGKCRPLPTGAGIQAVAGACAAQGAVRLRSGSRLEHFYYESTSLHPCPTDLARSQSRYGGQPRRHLDVFHGSVYRLFGQTIGKIRFAKSDWPPPKAICLIAFIRHAQLAGNRRQVGVLRRCALFQSISPGAIDMSPGAWRQMRLRLRAKARIESRHDVTRALSQPGRIGGLGQSSYEADVFLRCELRRQDAKV